MFSLITVLFAAFSLAVCDDFDNYPLAKICIMDKSGGENMLEYCRLKGEMDWNIAKTSSNEHDKCCSYLDALDCAIKIIKAKCTEPEYMESRIYWESDQDGTRGEFHTHCPNFPNNIDNYDTVCKLN